jgi:uracil-DNA glycosylase
MTALPPEVADAVALLAWYRAVGVDAALGDQPINWLERGAVKPGADFVWPEGMVAPGAARPARGSAQRPALQSVSPSMRQPLGSPTPPGPPPAKSAPRPSLGPTLGITPPPRAFPTATPDDATMAARTAAAGAKDLAALEKVLIAFNGCALKATAKTLCFYRGAPQARLMVIGDAPGREEDLAGKPYVGRAGQLLDRMLAAINLGEVDAHLSNIVYWRPPGDRPPTPQEAEICRPLVERQIALVQPEIVLLLGGAAANHILGVPEGIMRLRGQWKEITIAGRTIRAMATLHPTYLLRTPAAKRQAWRDLLALKAALAG